MDDGNGEPSDHPIAVDVFEILGVYRGGEYPSTKTHRNQCVPVEVAMCVSLLDMSFPCTSSNFHDLLATIVAPISNAANPAALTTFLTT